MVFRVEITLETQGQNCFAKIPLCVKDSQNLTIIGWHGISFSFDNCVESGDGLTHLLWASIRGPTKSFRIF